MNQETLSQIKQAVNELSADRKDKLQVLVDFLKGRKKSKTDLIFICVHNSRRSHLSQVWAQTAANFHYQFHLLCAPYTSLGCGISCV
mgnify:CR=1 FL=1